MLPPSPISTSSDDLGSVEKDPHPSQRPSPRPPRAAPVLTSRQRSQLRKLGHHLDPVVHVGKEGASDGLCAALGRALEQHELLKLKLTESAPGDRHELAADLAAGCGAALVQVLG